MTRSTEETPQHPHECEGWWRPIPPVAKPEKEATKVSERAACDEFNKQYPPGSICRYRNTDGSTFMGRTILPAAVGCSMVVVTPDMMCVGRLRSELEFPPPQGDGVEWRDVKTDPPTGDDDLLGVEVSWGGKAEVLLVCGVHVRGRQGWWRPVGGKVAEVPVEAEKTPGQVAQEECDKFNRDYPAGTLCRLVFYSRPVNKLVETVGAAWATEWRRQDTGERYPAPTLCFRSVSNNLLTKSARLCDFQFPPPRGDGAPWRDLKTDPPRPVGWIEVLRDGAASVAGTSAKHVHNRGYTGWWRVADRATSEAPSMGVPVQAPTEEATEEAPMRDVLKAARDQWYAVEKKFADEFYDKLAEIGVSSVNSCGVGATNVASSLVATRAVGVRVIHMSLAGTRRIDALPPAEQRLLVEQLPKLWEVARKTIRDTRQCLTTINDGLTKFLGTLEK